MELKDLIKKQEEELKNKASSSSSLGRFDLAVFDDVAFKNLKNFLSKTRQETIEHEKERIQEIIKDMPDTFPELESDDYDRAYQDAKQYMLSKLS